MIDPWRIEVTDKYERGHKEYEKKNPFELKAMLNNLDTYVIALNQLNNPLLIPGGFIHHKYPRGIKSIDQRGKSKVKLKQTRLYVYPDTKNRVLYLLQIGDKNTQQDDVKICVDFIKEIEG